MRRLLLWTALLGAVLVLLIVVIVEVNVPEAELPPPDVLQLITLPDGEILTLSEVLLRTLPAPQTAPGPLVDDAESAAAPEKPGAVAPDDAELPAELDPLYPGMAWTPLFALAEHHRQAGRLDQALALYQSIPADSPDYALARRRIAWDILTLGRDQPAAAVPVIRQALAADPLGGNAWQDTVRVYGRALGFALD